MYSVLMSVYKKELPENLRASVISMMEQTVPPDDFVLYCDGELTDSLYSEIEGLKKKYPVLNVVCGKKNQGLGIALSIGLGHCRNEIVARMDSDDIAFPVRMELELKAISEHNADVVSGTIEEFEGDVSNIIGVKRLPERHDEIKKYARRRNPFNHPCVCFKKESVYRAGNYEHCPYFEDYWLWARMLEKGCVFHNVPQKVLYMRSGKELYKRRGGLAYARCALSFRKKMRKAGYCGPFDYIYTCAGHILAAAAPNRLRMLLYSKVLRK